MHSQHFEEMIKIFFGLSLMISLLPLFVIILYSQIFEEIINSSKIFFSFFILLLIRLN